MYCPNCRHILTIVDLDKIQVEHCNNCGGTIFEENEINRITVKDAERLSLLKQSDSISGEQKLSPRDGSPFERIQSDSIPQHVTLLQSHSTGEIFAFAEDLLEFKKAQDAKVTYYKTWHIPVPAVQHMLVFGIAFLFAGAALYFSSMLQNPTQQAIQAQELCQGGIDMMKVQDDILASCLTDIPLSCSLQATCNGRVINVETSSAQTTHFGTVSGECEEVRFTCSDNNTSIETSWESTSNAH